MKLDFDQQIDRLYTASYKWDQSKILFETEDILPMWVADMDFMSPPAVVNALINRATHGVYGYTIIPDSYYSSIIDWLKRRHGSMVQKEWITHSPGVVTALSILVSCLTKPGDKVMIQSPVYHPFYDVVLQQNRELVTNNLILEDGRYTMDLKDLENKIDSSVKVMLLCNPHNPVGRVWDEQELERLGALCAKHNIIVISDEIHCDLIYKGNKHVPFSSISEKMKSTSITCISTSKTFNLAGLKTCNLIIQNPHIKEVYEKKLKMLSLHSESFFGITAVEAAYTHGEEWLNQLLIYLEGNLNFLLDYFKQHINEVKVIKPEGTYLVWLDFRGLRMNKENIEKWMYQKAKLALNEGSMFGENGKGFLRMNIACPRATLEEGLSRIRKEL
ncbi:pyridoxal phosphate-dependent aminotransferase [Bacillus thuringiensis]|jgi:cysteine-S-conjugate beta-lyase|uniref:cysteine-S-conjugate beta-lyase n=5 Tax=Bacillus thuringiensis TaxID=1428 RepID=A0AB35PP13_BACTU|nr:MULTISPECIES: MalY/PatB family protein [Bacillus]MED1158217.1 pyridoxal phosphate-dependent aminotransferase [Bacillus paranthracis]AFQ30485.1 putative class-II aminotransferase [Bacillus thuringiensis HD-789]AND28710.1 cystathionine beta-lyase [Bacillus thuringiensis serovar israelensis]ASO64540.1 putative class-II aminotransferase [Bacillus thuringiensis serovar israelensis]EEM99014.1 class-II aminotransferase [Bacillus thuringiensis IBL 4222]